MLHAGEQMTPKLGALHIHLRMTCPTTTQHQTRRLTNGAMAMVRIGMVCTFQPPSYAPVQCKCSGCPCVVRAYCMGQFVYLHGLWLGMCGPYGVCGSVAKRVALTSHLELLTCMPNSSMYGTCPTLSTQPHTLTQYLCNACPIAYRLSAHRIARCGNVSCPGGHGSNPDSHGTS